MIGISDIHKLTSRNIGGLARVQMIFERDILTIPVPVPGQLTLQGDIVLRAGAKAHYIYFTKKTSVFTEDTNISDAAGDFSVQSIRFDTPKDRPVLRNVVERCKNNRVAIVYQDRNGYFKIVRHLRVKTKTTSSTFQSYNGVSFQLTGISEASSGFWNYQPNEYILPPIGTGPVPDDNGGGSNLPAPYEDTNFANTDLTFLEDRIHNLEDKILALIGSGKMVLGGTTGDSKLTVIGGDIEVSDNGFGFILRDQSGNRWRLTISHHGVLQVNQQ